MPPKRTPRKKNAGSSRCWLASEDHGSLLLPNWKVDQYPKELSVLQQQQEDAVIGGFIFDKALYAITTHVGDQLSDSNEYIMS